MIGMTYGQFLLVFLVIPITGLACLALRDRLREPAKNTYSHGWAPWLVLTGLVLVAIIYTIPWDNHLIAERVWWYDPALVSGVTLGWIPLEEVLFFVLQTILIGLWVVWLLPRAASDEVAASLAQGEARAGGRKAGGESGAHQSRVARATPIRWIVVGVLASVWLVALAILLRNWQPGTYVGWELVWALPPLILQLGLGGDLLWRRRRLLVTALVPAVVYLSVADAVAIHAGIWTISPYQSLGLLLGGALPLEELLFFLVTSALVTCGLLLGLTPETSRRLHLGP